MSTEDDVFAQTGVDDARDAEVGEDSVSGLVYEHVLRLDVAVDDSCGVDGDEGLAHVAVPLGQAFLRSAVVRVLCVSEGQRVSVRACHEIHGEVRSTVSLFEREVVNKPGVVEAGERGVSPPRGNACGGTRRCVYPYGRA